MDTGAWIAISLRADRLHRTASQALRNLVRRRSLLVTSDYVFSETVTRLRYDAGHQAAITFMKFLDAAIEANSTRMVRIPDEIFSAARGLFETYEDQDFSFVDCTSFALVRSLGLDTVFGFDHHFLVMGFRLIP
ncbi:MAG: type II toxin-antitoxin system VapC family toxin [Candidatus Xenobia bacterium]